MNSSLPQIETGYKPEFGLGALYQGFNAANADQMSEQDILKAFLANQREQQQQPLDMLIKQWDAAHSQDKLNSPDYRNATLQGYIGQMNSQSAAGNLAQQTLANKILSENQELSNKARQGNLLEQFQNEQMNPTQQQGQIGFPIQQQEQNQTPFWGGEIRGSIAKQKDAIASMGTDYRTSNEMPNSRPTNQDIESAKRKIMNNPKISQAEKQDLLADFERSNKPVLSSFVQQPQQQNNTQDKLAQLQNVLVNTPEHLQKMEQIRQQGANIQGAAETRGQYTLETARERARMTVKNPKDTEVVAHAYQIVSKTIPSTPEEYEAAKNLIIIKTNVGEVLASARAQPGIDLGAATKGQVPMTTNPATDYRANPNSLFRGFSQQYTDMVNGPPKQQGTGTKDNPIKLQ